MPWGRAILAQVADALSALHSHEIIHRDIKPENVLVATVDAQPQVKLADFGIARLGGDLATPAMFDGAGDPPSALAAGDRELAAGADDGVGALRSAPDRTEPVGAETLGCSEFPPPEGERPRPVQRTPQEAGAVLTQTGMVMGTPGYLAPELLRGAKQAQLSADVFSLGVMAVEVLTGHRPKTSRSSLLRDSDPSVDRPPMTAGPGLPRSLIALIERAIARDPQQRPSAAELATALRTPSSSEA